MTKDVAESIGLGKAGGALVQSVEPGGPADKGGVEAGDIITRVEGRVVEKSGDLPRLIGNSKPGQRVTLQVFRRGAYRDLPVTVVEFDAPEPKTRSATGPSEKSTAQINAIGLAVSELTDAQKREMKVKSGVRVENVEGPAARAGVREGDVIMAIDNVEVTGVRQFENLVGKLDKSKPVTVLVRRGEWVNYVVIRPAPR